MRLLLLTNEYRPVTGGIATYCHALVRQLHEAGHEVTVIAAAKEGESPDFDAAEPYPLIRTSEYQAAWRRHWERWQAGSRLLQQQPQDWLWASDWRTGLVVATVARRYSLPFVVSAFGSELLQAQRSPLSRSLCRWVLRRAAQVLSISDYTTQLLQELAIPDDQISTIIPGTKPVEEARVAQGRLRIRKKYGLQATTPLILTLARLVERKGHQQILQALPLVREKIPEVIYMIAGDGEEHEALQTLVRQLGLDDSVIFAGYVAEDEKVDYYAACDLYALLNQQAGDDVEGFGITLLEASACGRPVLANNQEGALNAVQAGQTGYLIDAADGAAVVDALLTLLQDNECARQLGDQGRQFVVDFANWQRAAEQFMAVLNG